MKYPLLPLFLLPLLALPVPGAESPVDTDRIRRLESALEHLRVEFEDYRRSHPPRSASPGAVSSEVERYLETAQPTGMTRAESGLRGLRIGGYGTLAYVREPMATSRFDLSRLVISAGSSVSKGIDFYTEIEFEGGGITDEFGGEIEVEQATATLRIAECLQPKVGWLIIPFGRYNLHHDDPLNEFTVRPFTARFLIPTGFGQPGIGMSGSVPFGNENTLTYDAVVSNGFKDMFTANEGTGEARQNGDNNNGKQVWARVAAQWHAPFLDELETGLSGTYGIYDDADRNAITGFGMDWLARRGAFKLQGEYLAFHYERNPMDLAGSVRGQNGLWVEASWSFFPLSWRNTRMPALVTETSLFTIALRYERMNLDENLSGATFEDDLQGIGFALDYRITQRTVVRFDTEWLFPEVGGSRTQVALSLSTYF